MTEERETLNKILEAIRPMVDDRLVDGERLAAAHKIIADQNRALAKAAAAIGTAVLNAVHQGDRNTVAISKADLDDLETALGYLLGTKTLIESEAAAITRGYP